MIQVISFARQIPEGQNTHIAFTGGDGLGTRHPNQARFAVPIAGTIRNLKLLFPASQTHPDVTVALEVNGVDTALEATALSSDDTAANLTDEIAVVEEDLVAWSLDDPAIVSAYIIGISFEWEGDEQIFGVNATGGSPSPGQQVWSGAFSNSAWIGGYVGGTYSNTYSICAVTGDVTSLSVHSFIAPDAGSFELQLIKNLIVQDGTGGTVDTTVTITGASTYEKATFTLPVVPSDIIEVLYTRLGTTGDVVANIAAMVTVDSGDQFMLTGGNNAGISSTADTYNWNAINGQSTEDLSQVPIATGITTVGLYARKDQAPGIAGSGASYDHILRKDGVSQGINAEVFEDTLTGFQVASIDFEADSVLSLISTPHNSPTTSQLHWGLAATVSEPEPPMPPPGPPETQTYLIRRLRRAVHLSSEQFNQFFARLQIDINAGVGIPTGQGEDPQMMLRWSDDGGFTWSNEVWVSAGRQGQYTRRAIWNRLGTGRDRVFEVSVTDPVFWSILQAFIFADRGSS